MEQHSPASDSLSVAPISRDELRTCEAWRIAFAGRRKDHRYYEIIADTIGDHFEYGYFAIRDASGRVLAVQPYFLLDQDVLEGIKLDRSPLVARIRRRYPRFLKLRTLMLGCTAGEGHLATSAHLSAAVVAGTLALGIVAQARALGAQMIVLKEFPRGDRRDLACFEREGFGRAPSMPMTTLDIDYDSFDDYMQKALSANTRRNLRKKFRAAEGSDLEMTVTDNAASFIDELYPLYLQTYERSNFHFEKLTRDYFRRLGCEMSDKTRFFIWYRGNTLMAFALCMVEGDDIFAEYIGLDYDFALDLHLYHYISRDVIRWAMAHGYKRFRSSGLNYDPKLHLCHRLDPIDLYVRHVSPIANWIMRLALPWIVPVRYDATLRKFTDYRQMW
ncbi:GNAT family N-acetyltransferase [Nitrobacter sp. NHB1]|uniref:GNAT family N-acetyltransferase n=1 Tax=Nitrobacter sp. NHB1 TaxID=3119830 RepID=UPI002FFF8672